jgi:NAD(P)-dependent dehydrogenase (short-subunit alcohol dehydrogenase family)
MNDRALSRRTAIVTGSTSGIGRATAIALAGQGARVVVTGRNEERGRATVETIDRSGGTAMFVRQEVTEEEDWRRLFERTLAAYGRLDILINNAGDCILKPIDEMPLDLLYFHLRVNLEACFLGMKFAVEAMRDAGGVILNISSVAGLKGGIGGTAYGASKAGMTQLSQAAAAECRRDGLNIRVNSIHPGLIWGEGVAEAMGEDGAAKFRKMIVARTPLKRVGAPDDIAAVVLYLVSDEAAAINGTQFVADGGYMAV